MSRQTKTIRVRQKQDVSITCDKCGQTTGVDDILEYQEYYTIDFIGGVGSIFGDMIRVECDLCQTCLEELLCPYYRTS